MHQQRSLNEAFLLKWLLAAALICAAAMISSAILKNGPLVSAAAALFALAVSVMAVVVNFDAWRPAASETPSESERKAVAMLKTNASIGALAYGWGAIAMQGLYLTPLTGLKWQHGWQYALVMALLSAGSFAFARSLVVPEAGLNPNGWRTHLRLARPLALFQGLVAGGGLATLAISGKLSSIRADWAANRVFAALAVAIIAVTIAILVTQARTTRVPND